MKEIAIKFRERHTHEHKHTEEESQDESQREGIRLLMEYKGENH